MLLQRGMHIARGPTSRRSLPIQLYRVHYARAGSSRLGQDNQTSHKFAGCSRSYGNNKVSLIPPAQSLRCTRWGRGTFDLSSVARLLETSSGTTASPLLRICVVNRRNESVYDGVVKGATDFPVCLESLRLRERAQPDRLTS